jgi:hypothetical protein
VSEPTRSPGDAAAELPELETPCVPCQSRGWMLHAGKKHWCATCDGAGYVPTAFGRKVLNLIRHNWRQLSEDMNETEPE